MSEQNLFPPHLNVTVLTDVPLSDYSTFRLGGPCKTFIPCENPIQLSVVVKTLYKQEHPFTLFGGGSNLLISDQGIDGIVVRFVNPTLEVERVESEISVSAACSLDALAAYTAEQGLEGLLCCTGIPGTVGGAIVGNAGAWGNQIADVLKSVTLMSRDGSIREMDPDRLGFAYRRSDLQQGDDIVLSARLLLRPADPEKLGAERKDILKIRSEKHPDLEREPCIGSIFRNIEPTSAAGRRQAAGGFLEDAGAKNLSVGGARVYEKHANIVIKGDGCQAQDVYELIQRMKELVQKKFEMDLIPEVRFLGDFSEVS